MKEEIINYINGYAGGVWHRALLVFVVAIICLFLADYILTEGSLLWCFTTIYPFISIISLIPDFLIKLTSMFLKRKKQRNE